MISAGIKYNLRLEVWSWCNSLKIIEDIKYRDLHKLIIFTFNNPIPPIAPMTCAATYIGTRINSFNSPRIKAATVTAGFRWAPEMWPNIYILKCY